MLDGFRNPAVARGRARAWALAAGTALEKDEQGQVVALPSWGAQDAVEQLDALGGAGDRGGHGAASHGGAHGKQRRLEPAPVEGDVDGVVFDIEAGNVIAGKFGHGCSFGVV